ncbi:MAG TPA: FMN-binding protein [Acidimicrobiales bacterium]|jgi:uncharacterized protein with FMN-binding domain|nr:FMN-binding protein [Acidimicrobiales bacterium]
MRRAPFVVAGTVAGVAGVLLFHPQSGVSLGTIPSASTSSGAGSSSSAASSASSGSAGGSGSAAAGSSTSTSTGSSNGTSGTATTTMYTGTSVTYNYGVLAVKITVSGHKVTNVGIASLTDGGNFRSQSIDQQAIPTLEQEALAAQSANIQSVSGASYTSAGFARSLQSALSKAGL